MARKRRRQSMPGVTTRQTAGSSWSPDHPEITKLLCEAKVSSCRPIMWGSNSTFLITLCTDTEAGESHAVYKPRRGEAPLWDFPRGTLYRREMATYVVSEALGWSLVPATVVRDGPYGIGSVQLFIEHDPHDYFCAPVQRDRAAAEQVSLLDILLNNADRKTEHCIQGLDGRLWAIDHGLTFHTDPKLRTVIWDFAGEAIPDSLIEDLEMLADALQPRSTLVAAMLRLIEQEEIDALLRRLRYLLRERVHPDPGSHRRVMPWPSW